MDVLPKPSAPREVEVVNFLSGKPSKLDATEEAQVKEVLRAIFCRSDLLDRLDKMDPIESARLLYSVHNEMLRDYRIKSALLPLVNRVMSSNRGPLIALIQDACKSVPDSMAAAAAPKDPSVDRDEEAQRLVQQAEEEKRRQEEEEREKQAAEARQKELLAREERERELQRRAEEARREQQRAQEERRLKLEEENRLRLAEEEKQRAERQAKEAESKASVELETLVRKIRQEVIESLANDSALSISLREKRAQARTSPTDKWPILKSIGDAFDSNPEKQPDLYSPLHNLERTFQFLNSDIGVLLEHPRLTERIKEQLEILRNELFFFGSEKAVFNAAEAILEPDHPTRMKRLLQAGKDATEQIRTTIDRLEKIRTELEEREALHREIVVGLEAIVATNQTDMIRGLIVDIINLSADFIDQSGLQGLQDPLKLIQALSSYESPSGVIDTRTLIRNKINDVRPLAEFEKRRADVLREIAITRNDHLAVAKRSINGASELIQGNLNDFWNALSKRVDELFQEVNNPQNIRYRRLKAQAITRELQAIRSKATYLTMASDRRPDPDRPLAADQKENLIEQVNDMAVASFEACQQFKKDFDLACANARTSPDEYLKSNEDRQNYTTLIKFITEAEENVSKTRENLNGTPSDSMVALAYIINSNLHTYFTLTFKLGTLSRIRNLLVKEAKTLTRRPPAVLMPPEGPSQDSVDASQPSQSQDESEAQRRTPSVPGSPLSSTSSDGAPPPLDAEGDAPDPDLQAELDALLAADDDVPPVSVAADDVDDELLRVRKETEQARERFEASIAVLDSESDLEFIEEGLEEAARQGKLQAKEAAKKRREQRKASALGDDEHKQRRLRLEQVRIKVFAALKTYEIVPRKNPDLVGKAREAELNKTLESFRGKKISPLHNTLAKDANGNTIKPPARLAKKPKKSSKAGSDAEDDPSSTLPDPDDPDKAWTLANAQRSLARALMNATRKAGTRVGNLHEEKTEQVIRSKKFYAMMNEFEEQANLLTVLMQQTRKIVEEYVDEQRAKKANQEPSESSTTGPRIPVKKGRGAPKDPLGEKFVFDMVADDRILNEVSAEDNKRMIQIVNRLGTIGNDITAILRDDLKPLFEKLLDAKHKGLKLYRSISKKIYKVLNPLRADLLALREHIQTSRPSNDLDDLLEALEDPKNGVEVKYADLKARLASFLEEVWTPEYAKLSRVDNAADIVQKGLDQVLAAAASPQQPPPQVPDQVSGTSTATPTDQVATVASYLKLRDAIAAVESTTIGSSTFAGIGLMQGNGLIICDKDALSGTPTFDISKKRQKKLLAWELSKAYEANKDALAAKPKGDERKKARKAIQKEVLNQESAKEKVQYRQAIKYISKDRKQLRKAVLGLPAKLEAYGVLGGDGYATELNRLKDALGKKLDAKKSAFEEDDVAKVRKVARQKLKPLWDLYVRYRNLMSQIYTVCTLRILAACMRLSSAARRELAQYLEQNKDADPADALKTIVTGQIAYISENWVLDRWIKKPAADADPDSPYKRLFEFLLQPSTAEEYKDLDQAPRVLGGTPAPEPALQVALEHGLDIFDLSDRNPIDLVNEVTAFVGLLGHTESGSFLLQVEGDNEPAPARSSKKQKKQLTEEELAARKKAKAAREQARRREKRQAKGQGQIQELRTASGEAIDLSTLEAQVTQVKRLQTILRGINTGLMDEQQQANARLIRQSLVGLLNALSNDPVSAPSEQNAQRIREASKTMETLVEADIANKTRRDQLDDEQRSDEEDEASEDLKEFYTIPKEEEEILEEEGILAVDDEYKEEEERVGTAEELEQRQRIKTAFQRIKSMTNDIEQLVDAKDQDVFRQYRDKVASLERQAESKGIRKGEEVDAFVSERLDDVETRQIDEIINQARSKLAAQRLANSEAVKAFYKKVVSDGHEKLDEHFETFEEIGSRLDFEYARNNMRNRALLLFDNRIEATAQEAFDRIFDELYENRRGYRATGETFERAFRAAAVDVQKSLEAEEFVVNLEKLEQKLAAKKTGATPTQQVPDPVPVPAQLGKPKKRVAPTVTTIGASMQVLPNEPLDHLDLQGEIAANVSRLGLMLYSLSGDPERQTETNKSWFNNVPSLPWINQRAVYSYNQSLAIALTNDLSKAYRSLAQEARSLIQSNEFIDSTQETVSLPRQQARTTLLNSLYKRSTQACLVARKRIRSLAKKLRHGYPTSVLSTVPIRATKDDVADIRKLLQTSDYTNRLEARRLALSDRMEDLILQRSVKNLDQEVADWLKEIGSSLGKRIQKASTIETLDEIEKELARLLDGPIKSLIQSHSTWSAYSSRRVTPVIREKGRQATPAPSPVAAVGKAPPRRQTDPTEQLNRRLARFGFGEGSDDATSSAGTSTKSSPASVPSPDSDAESVFEDADDADVAERDRTIMSTRTQATTRTQPSVLVNPVPQQQSSASVRPTSVLTSEPAAAATVVAPAQDDVETKRKLREQQEAEDLQAEKTRREMMEATAAAVRQLEAEAEARRQEEARRKAEADRIKKQEQERLEEEERQRQERERKQAEEQQRARRAAQEAEERRKAEESRRAEEERLQREREAEERRLKLEADRKAREEEERAKKAEEDRRKAQQEEERRQQQEAARKKAEEDRKRQLEQEEKARREAEQRAEVERVRAEQERAKNLVEIAIAGEAYANVEKTLTEQIADLERVQKELLTDIDVDEELQNRLRGMSGNMIRELKQALENFQTNVRARTATLQMAQGTKRFIELQAEEIKRLVDTARLVIDQIRASVFALAKSLRQKQLDRLDSIVKLSKQLVERMERTYLEKAGGSMGVNQLKLKDEQVQLSQKIESLQDRIINGINVSKPPDALSWLATFVTDTLSFSVVVRELEKSSQFLQNELNDEIALAERLGEQLRKQREEEQQQQQRAAASTRPSVPASKPSAKQTPQTLVAPSSVSKPMPAPAPAATSVPSPTSETEDFMIDLMLEGPSDKVFYASVHQGETIYNMFMIFMGKTNESNPAINSVEIARWPGQPDRLAAIRMPADSGKSKPFVGIIVEIKKKDLDQARLQEHLAKLAVWIASKIELQFRKVGRNSLPANVYLSVNNADIPKTIAGLALPSTEKRKFEVEIANGLQQLLKSDEKSKLAAFSFFMSAAVEAPEPADENDPENNRSKLLLLYKLGLEDGYNPKDDKFIQESIGNSITNHPDSSDSDWGLEEEAMPRSAKDRDIPSMAVKQSPIASPITPSSSWAVINNKPSTPTKYDPNVLEDDWV